MSYSNKESKNELNKETLSVTININKIKSLVVTSNTYNNNQPREDFQNTTEEYIDTLTLTFSRDDVLAFLTMARDVFLQPQHKINGSAGRDFGELIGREQFEIIASYWSKNVDDQIGTIWLNRVLNEASIPENASDKYVSDLLKQAYFRILDQFSTKRASINAPRIYAKKVILSVFNGD